VNKWVIALPVSSKSISPFHYGLVGVWLFGVVIGFIYLINMRLVMFDPQQKLLNTPAMSMLNDLKEMQGSGIKRSIFHFVDKSCHCAVLTEPHKLIINNIALGDEFEVVNIDLESSEAAPFITATPAILITDDNESLLYVGPYATGLDCSADNSLVDVVLNNYRQGFSSPTIISDAKGCYCQR